jgi:hypothetical protein
MNLKSRILIIGIIVISIISLVAASLLNCTIYGTYIAIFDVVAIFMWIIVGNYVINSLKKGNKT